MIKMHRRSQIWTWTWTWLKRLSLSLGVIVLWYWVDGGVMGREDRGDLQSHSDMESRIAPSVNLALVGEAKTTYSRSIIFYNFWKSSFK